MNNLTYCVGSYFKLILTNHCIFITRNLADIYTNIICKKAFILIIFAIVIIYSNNNIFWKLQQISVTGSSKVIIASFSTQKTQQDDYSTLMIILEFSINLFLS